MPIVSVIVPLYNNKRFVGECITSILNQTLQDIEVILVDDGSTDGGLAYCQQRFGRNSRVRMYSLSENQGPGQARNRGLDLATGKYVVFVDSDDRIKPDMLESLYHVAEQNNADIVHSRGRWLLSEDGGYEEACIDDRIITKQPQLLPASREKRMELLASRAFYAALWTKMFSLQFLREHNIRFAAITNDEDWLFVYQCLKYAGRVLMIPQLYYEYRVTNHSILRGDHPDSKIADYMHTLAVLLYKVEEKDVRRMFIADILKLLQNGSWAKQDINKRADIVQMLESGAAALPAHDAAELIGILLCKLMGQRQAVEKQLLLENENMKAALSMRKV